MDQESRLNNRVQIKIFKAHKMEQQIRSFNNHPPKETVETYPLRQNQSKKPKQKPYKIRNPKSSPKSPLLYNLTIKPLKSYNRQSNNNKTHNHKRNNNLWPHLARILPTLPNRTSNNNSS
jgi:hypothetical protein